MKAKIWMAKRIGDFSFSYSCNGADCNKSPLIDLFRLLYTCLGYSKSPLVLKEKIKALCSMALLDR